MGIARRCCKRDGSIPRSRGPAVSTRPAFAPPHLALSVSPVVQLGKQSAWRASVITPTSTHTAQSKRSHAVLVALQSATHVPVGGPPPKNAWLVAVMQKADAGHSASTLHAPPSGARAPLSLTPASTVLGGGQVHEPQVAGLPVQTRVPAHAAAPVHARSSRAGSGHRSSAARRRTPRRATARPPGLLANDHPCDAAPFAL